MSVDDWFKSLNEAKFNTYIYCLSKAKSKYNFYFILLTNYFKEIKNKRKKKKNKHINSLNILNL
jgi:hypothetical protein